MPSTTNSSNPFHSRVNYEPQGTAGSSVDPVHDMINYTASNSLNHLPGYTALNSQHAYPSFNRPEQEFHGANKNVDFLHKFYGGEENRERQSGFRRAPDQMFANESIPSMYLSPSGQPAGQECEAFPQYDPRSGVYHNGLPDFTDVNVGNPFGRVLGDDIRQPHVSRDVGSDERQYSNFDTPGLYGTNHGGYGTNCYSNSGLPTIAEELGYTSRGIQNVPHMSSVGVQYFPDGSVAPSGGYFMPQAGTGGVGAPDSFVGFAQGRNGIPMRSFGGFEQKGQGVSSGPFVGNTVGVPKESVGLPPWGYGHQQQPFVITGTVCPICGGGDYHTHAPGSYPGVAVQSNLPPGSAARMPAVPPFNIYNTVPRQANVGYSTMQGVQSLPPASAPYSTLQPYVLKL